MESKAPSLDKFFKSKREISGDLTVALEGAPSDETVVVEGSPQSAPCMECKVVKKLKNADGSSNMVKVGSAKGANQKFKCSVCNRYLSKLSGVKASDAELHRSFMDLTPEQKQKFKDDFGTLQTAAFKEKMAVHVGMYRTTEKETKAGSEAPFFALSVYKTRFGYTDDQLDAIQRNANKRWDTVIEDWEYEKPMLMTSNFDIERSGSTSSWAPATAKRAEASGGAASEASASQTSSSKSEEDTRNKTAKKNEESEAGESSGAQTPQERSSATAEEQEGRRQGYRHPRSADRRPDKLLEGKVDDEASPASASIHRRGS